MNYAKAIIGGRLTRDPSTKQLPNATICEFGVAVNSRRGEKERTAFFDCKAFNKTAELIQQHFTKGKPIFIDGRLDYESWEASDGSKRSKVLIVVDNFQFVGPPSDGTKGGQSETPGITSGATEVPEDSIPF